ncbi:hypothetical protein TKK_0008566 [Trichogramma kaykai]
MRELNESACNALYEAVEWSSPGIVVTLCVLAVVNVMVVVGNCLVIAAVYHSIKLRNVTNMFIVSLAVADLMVGVAVLPFSATWEVFKVWIFGDIWCSIWLAVDVWMCTASILNLCAISLDRYLAVTRPVNYPQVNKRTSYLYRMYIVPDRTVEVVNLLEKNSDNTLYRGKYFLKDRAI